MQGLTWEISKSLTPCLAYVLIHTCSMCLCGLHAVSVSFTYWSHTWCVNENKSRPSLFTVRPNILHIDVPILIWNFEDIMSMMQKPHYIVYEVYLCVEQVKHMNCRCLGCTTLPQIVNVYSSVLQATWFLVYSVIFVGVARSC